MQKKRKIFLSSGVALAICVSVGFSTLAAPSISDLHHNKEQMVIQPTSTDGTNTAALLAAAGIYTNEAVSDQYKQKDEAGNLVAVPLSDLVDLGAGTITEVDRNGSSIPDDICTVEKMIDQYCADANVDRPDDKEVDLSNLDQLTYWLDFKYETTDYRVVAKDKVYKDGSEEELDDGMMTAEIDGGEIIRAAEIEDYLIIQIDASSGEIHYLHMKDYDPETGKYTVEFPCVGPYMITQVIR